MTGSAHCRRNGCGARIEERLDSIGRLTFACPNCERNKRGVCRDCPRHLTNPRALRCEPCRIKRLRERHNRSCRKSWWKRHDEVLARQRAYAQRPEVRARRLAKLAEYRAQHPVQRDDQLRAYHRVWMRERRNDPALRERENARRRELAARKREQAVAA